MHRIPQKLKRPDWGAGRSLVTKESTSARSSSASLLNQSDEQIAIPIEKHRAASFSSCGASCWLAEISEIPSGHDRFDLDNFIQCPITMQLPVPDPIYRRLKPWQTRLIVLEPSNNATSLVCSIIEADIIDSSGFGVSGTAEIVAFKALSYSWGLGDRKHYLVCNGQPLRVPGQLVLALLYLRSHSKTLYIWCDAVCINQDDLEEKAVQVRNMFRIFEKAESVIAWLGTPSTDLGRTLRALRAATDLDTVPLSAWRDHEQICRARGLEVRVSITKFLLQPWFQRTWIRQEVYAAKKLKLQVAHRTWEFHNLVQIIAQIDEDLRKLGIEDPEILIPPTLRTYAEEYQHSGADRAEFKPGELPTYTAYWLHTLINGARFQVTDEQDRVYGALGILMNRNVRFAALAPADVDALFLKFPISYQKSVPEVYQDVTKFLINSLQSLEILDYLQPKSILRDSEPYKMPFWARNWALPASQIGFYHPSSSIKPSHSDVLQQDYSQVGQLVLKGISMIRKFTTLDSTKEIAHPRDRFYPKFRRSITLRELAQQPRRRRSNAMKGASIRIDHPPHAFVYTYVDGSATGYEIKNEVVGPTDIDPEFFDHLAGDDFIFGYPEDYPGTDSLQLGDLAFLLPRITQLDDKLISLHGSRCLHLVRPLAMKDGVNQTYGYIAPVIAFVCGQDQVDSYSTKSRRGRLLLSTDSSQGNTSSKRGEIFRLV